MIIILIIPISETAAGLLAGGAATGPLAGAAYFTVCLRVYTHLSIYMYIHTHICIYIYIHIYTHIYIYTNTYTYVYMYI